MTKSELLKELERFGEDEVIVISDNFGGWDNIDEVGRIDGTAAIFFGGGSPFTDER